MNIDVQVERLGFALVKIAAYVRRADLRRRIEGSAFDLVDTVSRRNVVGFFESAPALEAIVRLGKAIYEIEPMNADMIISEIGNLKLGIRQFADLSLPSKDMQSGAEFQSQSLWANSQEEGTKVINEDLKRYRYRNTATVPVVKQIKAADTKVAKIPEKEEKPVSSIVGVQEEIKPEEQSLDNPAIRQSAIADKIRKFGSKNVQLKDIVAAFPNVSDRTIRYDIQWLCSQGIIERIGQGGPGTYYRARVI